MKTYQVELKRTSYITVTVEAADEGEAKALAWQESMGFHSKHDTSWNIESAEEVAPREEIKTWRESIEVVTQGESA